MKILFLDIDGPINTYPNTKQHRIMGKSSSSNYITLPRENLLNLRKIVVTTHAKIVLSSNWRKDKKAIMNLSNQLYMYGMRIYDYTPIDKSEIRGIEIQHWLDKFKYKHNYYPNYVIVDDEIETIINYHRGHCIHVEQNVGLTRDLADIAINILSKPYGYKTIRMRGINNVISN